MLVCCCSHCLLRLANFVAIALILVSWIPDPKQSRFGEFFHLSNSFTIFQGDNLYGWWWIAEWWEARCKDGYNREASWSNDGVKQHLPELEQKLLCHIHFCFRSKHIFHLEALQNGWQVKQMWKVALFWFSFISNETDRGKDNFTRQSILLGHKRAWSSKERKN